MSALLAAHDRAFADMRTYFREVTHANLDLIKTLKDESAELKRREASDERIMFAIAAENKRMSEPMRKALDEVRNRGGVHMGGLLHVGTGMGNCEERCANHCCSLVLTCAVHLCPAGRATAA